jgi:hypothetical protein
MQRSYRVARGTCAVGWLWPQHDQQQRPRAGAAAPTPHAEHFIKSVRPGTCYATRWDAASQRRVRMQPPLAADCAPATKCPASLRPQA